MNVRELMERLAGLDPKLEVEIATSPDKDQWYQIPADEGIEVSTNCRGHLVAVINTD